jgi:CheY-like chemotaxis protein
MRQIRPIWLVEDSANDVELTMAALEDCHVANRVIVMRDGSEALRALQELNGKENKEFPVVILMDIKMPKVSGSDVLRVLKADPKLKKLPVVMITSSHQGPDIAECYQLGANAYVVKPVDFNSFSDAVKKLGVFWAVINEPPPKYCLRSCEEV